MGLLSKRKREAIKRVTPDTLLNLYRRFVAEYRHHMTDCYFISYPKCGRTWVRVMLAKVITLHFQDSQDTAVHLDPMKVLRDAAGKSPGIMFTHDGYSLDPELETESPLRRVNRYKKKKVIFMVRDPRDVLVSYYFHKTRRQKSEYGKSLSDFIRDPTWGMERLEEFTEKWYQRIPIPRDFMVLRYEDLHKNPPEELCRVLEFLDIIDVPDDVIQSAVEYSSFNNLRSMTINQLRSVPSIAPTDPNDPQSFKLREGKVGGYVNYLSAADVAYVEERMNRKIWEYFGYKIS